MATLKVSVPIDVHTQIHHPTAQQVHSMGHGTLGRCHESHNLLGVGILRKVDRRHRVARPRGDIQPCTHSSARPGSPLGDTVCQAVKFVLKPARFEAHLAHQTSPNTAPKVKKI